VTCHPGSAAPAAGLVLSSLITTGGYWLSHFFSSPSTPTVWKQGETLTPTRSIQCEAFGHGFQSLGGV